MKQLSPWNQHLGEHDELRAALAGGEFFLSVVMPILSRDEQRTMIGELLGSAKAYLEGGGLADDMKSRPWRDAAAPAVGGSWLQAARVSLQQLVGALINMQVRCIHPPTLFSKKIIPPPRPSPVNGRRYPDQVHVNGRRYSD